MKYILTSIVAIVVLLGIGGLWLYAKPQETQELRPSAPAAAVTDTVGIPSSTPSMIVAGTLTTVTVSVSISPAPLSNGVNLLLVGSTTQPSILGVMNNAGNGIYTLQVPLLEAAAGQIQLQVSAAFPGQLRRVISQPIQIAVWNVLTSTSSQFTAPYPPTLYLTYSSTAGIYFLDSSPGGVAIGDAPGPGSSEVLSGFRVVISATPYTVSGAFNINEYLSAQYGNSVADLAAVASTPIGGQPGYEFTFQNEEGGGKPVAVVYYNGSVYEFDYASTNYVPGFSDQAGLSAFNAVLSAFTFNQ